MRYKETELGKIPNDWNLETLENISKRVKVGFVGSCNNFYCDKQVGIPMIRTTNLTKGKINMNDLKYITKEFYEKNQKSQLNFGDILIARHGNNGMASLWDKFIKAQCLNVVIVETDQSKVDPIYLTYSINSPIVNSQVLSRVGGSVQDVINTKTLAKLLIPYPEIKKQKRIIRILKSLDDKIEINNEMNKTLEEMAQTLFKRWFIDFEFPNENGESYKSSGGKMIESELGMIPEGWEIVSFSELIELFNGYSYKGKELMKSNNAMITIKNFNRNGGFQVEGFKEISISDKVRENHYVNKGDVIVAHTDLTQGAEIIGNSIYIQTFGKYEKIITSMDTVKIKSKNHEISNLLIHMFLNHKKFKEHALGYVNGTTVLHLSKKAIPEYKIAIPINKKIFDNMDKLLKPIYKEQNLKLEEIWELTEIRDTLLPKLMSGEIEV